MKKLLGLALLLSTSLFAQLSAISNELSPQFRADLNAQLGLAVSTAGTYSDPSWLTGLSWSKFVAGTGSGTSLPTSCTSGNFYQITGTTNNLSRLGAYACDASGVWRFVAGSTGYYSTIGNSNFPAFRNPGTNGAGPIGSTALVLPGYGNAFLAKATTGTFTTGSTTITVADATGIALGQSVLGFGLSMNTPLVTNVSGTTITIDTNTTLTEVGTPLQFWTNYYGSPTNLTILDSTTVNDTNKFNMQCCIVADVYSRNGYALYLEVFNVNTTNSNPNHIQFISIGEFTQNGQTSYLDHIGFGFGKGSHGSFYPFAVNHTGGSFCWDSNLDGTFTSASTLSSCLVRIVKGISQSGNVLEVDDSSGTAQTAVDSNFNVVIRQGSSTVYRCSVAGTLRVGQITTVPSDCGTAVDIGLRTN